MPKKSKAQIAKEKRNAQRPGEKVKVLLKIDSPIIAFLFRFRLPLIRTPPTKVDAKPKTARTTANKKLQIWTKYVYSLFTIILLKFRFNGGYPI